jgi:hypothetical protein
MMVSIQGLFSVASAWGQAESQGVGDVSDPIPATASSTKDTAIAAMAAKSVATQTAVVAA